MFTCSYRCCQVGNVLPRKIEILQGRGGSRLWNSEGMGGGVVTHFGISKGKGGLKHGSRPLLGMDIFWNCPIHHSHNKPFAKKNLPGTSPSSVG